MTGACHPLPPLSQGIVCSCWLLAAGELKSGIQGSGTAAKSRMCLFGVLQPKPFCLASWQTWVFPLPLSWLCMSEQLPPEVPRAGESVHSPLPA